MCIRDREETRAADKPGDNADDIAEIKKQLAELQSKLSKL